MLSRIAKNHKLFLKINFACRICFVLNNTTVHNGKTEVSIYSDIF